MPQKLTSLLAAAALLLSCSACSSATGPVVEGETQINLSDSTITVDGSPASTDPTSAVYTGAELVYYHDGTDETYGEGLADEMHSQADALAHTVLTITQPGTYRLTGTLSQGQVAVDLGEDAAQDPQAVVTLILDQVDVTCTVAPALIFYRVYECGTAETETAAADVDTSAAGANVVIAAGTENHFTGSHVARIYQEGTTDKLHKYDGAFYSKMSMNIRGDNGDDSGVLNIVSDNEGLDSELHLTVDGGTIHIQAQDDGINTNEDGVSVTTINGGSLTINAGLGTEGDGIDSNGYLVINGGTVWSMANETSPDGGIDADMAILLNGGTVYAFGTRNDAVDASSSQPYMELSFASTLPAGSVISVQDPDGQEIISAITEKTCQSVTVSCPDLSEDIAYAVYVDGVQQQYTGNRSGMMGGPGGGQPPDGMGGGQRPDNMEPPQEGEQVQTTERPEPTQDTPQVQPTDGLEEPPAGGTAGQPDSDRTPPDGMEDRQPPDGFGPSQTGGPGSEGFDSRPGYKD